MARILSVRLNDAEDEALRRAASLRGVGQSTFVRQAIRDAVGLSEKPDDDERWEKFDRRVSRLEEMAGL